MKRSHKKVQVQILVALPRQSAGRYHRFLMKKDDAALATRGDLQILRAELCQHTDCLQVQINELAKYVKAEAEETRRHFDVVAEDLRHDVFGAYNDKIVDLGRDLRRHEHRINRLEKRAGIIAM